MPKQVFEGLKVADFSWVAVGPAISRELALHGATVVRVECHRYPDTLRTAGPFKDGITGIDRSGFYAAYNTNKYGISVDLNMEKGREIGRKLVAWADVVTDSMTPGAMAKWGLDYESCVKINPGIIYYSTTQMGQKGPYSAFKGYGALGVAYSGYFYLNGWPGGEPLPLFNNYSDFISPYYLYTGLVAALLYRRRTGKGMYLDQSQVEVGVNFLAPQVLDYIVNGRVACRMGNRDPYMAPHNIFQCSEPDRWVAIAVPNDDAWSALCSTMGRPELATDPEYASFKSRKANEDALEALIGEWAAGFTSDELVKMLQDSGVPAGPVESAEDLFNDPQLQHRQHFKTLEHPVIGPQAYQHPSYRMTCSPCDLRKPGPCLGGDNEYVYKEILGLSDDEIADLLIEGVITTEHDMPAVLKKD